MKHFVCFPLSLNPQPLAQCLVNSRHWMYACWHELNFRDFPSWDAASAYWRREANTVGFKGVRHKKSSSRSEVGAEDKTKRKPNLQGKGISIEFSDGAEVPSPVPVPQSSPCQCTPGFQLPQACCLKALPEASEGLGSCVQSSGPAECTDGSTLLGLALSRQLVGLACKCPSSLPRSG